MRFVLFLMIIFGVISCEKKNDLKKNKYKTYVISTERKKYEEALILGKNCDTCIVPLVHMPIYLYGTENFILDDSSNVYYYQLERFYSAAGCGTGMEEEMKRDSIPVFKSLIPERIIQIPLSYIDDFIRLNLRRDERNLVKIASQKDTLDSDAYFKLIEALENNLEFRYDNDSYFVYRTTQEEDSVLHYKKYKKIYDTDSIKWDKNRIKFPKKF